MKKYTKKLAAITLTTLSLGLVSPLISQIDHFSGYTVSVKASTIAANGPWETDTQGTDEIQHVYNGNQIYYSIDPSSAYQKYAKQAAADWNALGVIDLVQVPWGDQRSQIQVSSDTSESPDGESGDTEFGNSVSYDS